MMRAAFGPVLSNLLVKITDPKTGAAIEFLPGRYFGWSYHPAMAKPQGSNYMGIIQWPPIRDPAEFNQPNAGSTAEWRRMEKSP